MIGTGVVGNPIRDAVTGVRRSLDNNVKRRAFIFLIGLFSALPLYANRKITSAPGNNNPVQQFYGRFVSVGDSFTHGFQGGAVDETRQADAYGARIASKMNTGYEMPLLKYPGHLFNMEDVWKGSIRWYQWYCGIVGCRKTFDNQDNLNNFAVTGENVQSVLSTGGAAGGFHRLSLGDGGRPQLAQALDRNPSFLTLWIGMTDVMGAAVHGDAARLSPVTFFAESFRTIAARIAQKQTAGILKGVVVANVPEVTSIAYFEKRPDGSYKAFWDKTISAETDGLSADEIARARKSVAEINSVIAEEAAANGWALFDAHAFLGDVKEYGYFLKNASGAPTTRQVTADYLGGVFSLDGIHPSSTAHAMLANRFLEALSRPGFAAVTGGPVDEALAADKDTLFTNPVDPRPAVMSGWYGKALTFLFDLLI